MASIAKILALYYDDKLDPISRWFTPYELLKIATADNAELLNLSGPWHPYREGPLGVIREGAYADLILVDLMLVDENHSKISI